MNINQFKQAPVRGELDLQIQRDGVISGQISVNEAGSPKSGDPVLLDAANTGSYPQFVLAAEGDEAIGYIAYDVKRSGGYVPGDVVQVTFFGGPVMYMVAEAAIAPGALVEQNANGNVQTLGTGSRRGQALDPGVTGGLLRIILNPALA